MNAPRSLGRYQLLFMLGQGGMGEVHLAKLTGAAGFEKLCIVKTILPQMQADQQFVDRFHHEARVLVQLNHSNIAQVYDMGEVDGTLYMAIEYVPGVDLSRVESRMRRQQVSMPVPVALYLSQQIAEALGYAHRKTGADGAPLGIVHRDVSPQNVMVSYEGEVKVIDFGLAKSAGRSQHTLPQTVMGKLGYMSPEQAMAKATVDHRSDIFSAGIVAWEMLAGRPLYSGGTMGEMLAQMAYPNIPSLRSVRPEVSPTLEQIVMRALQTDPAARYARADDFARALNELSVREGLSVGAEDVGNYVRAMCPEEFAAERLLQSKLSLMRKKGAEPAPEEVPIDAPGTEGTFLKPSSPGVAAEQDMTPAQRALSVVQGPAAEAGVDPNPGRGRTVVRKQPSAAQPAPVPSQPGKGRTVVQQKSPRPAAAKSAPAQVEPEPVEHPSEPIVIPRSRAPAIVAALAFLGLVGGGAWYAWSGGTPKTELPARPQKVAEAPEKPVQDEKQDVVAPAEDAGTMADSKSPEEPATPTKQAKTLGLVELVGAPREIQIEEDRAILLRKREDKEVFREGDSVLIVGESEDGKRVPLYARATVTVSTRTLVKAAPTEGELVEGVKLFIMKDKPSRSPLVARREPTKLDEADEPEAPAKKDPVRIEPEPVKHEPVVKNEPVKAPEPKKAEVPVTTTTAAATPSGLTGAIGVSPAGGAGGQIIRIQNQSGRVLTGCSVRLTSNRSASIATLAPGEVRMRYADFRPDPRPPDPQANKGWSAVVCKEGSGYFWTTWLTR